MRYIDATSVCKCCLPRGRDLIERASRTERVDARRTNWAWGGGKTSVSLARDTCRVSNGLSNNWGSPRTADTQLAASGTVKCLVMLLLSSELGTENRKVGGSTPPLATTLASGNIALRSAHQRPGAQLGAQLFRPTPAVPAIATLLTSLMVVACSGSPEPAPARNSPQPYATYVLRYEVSTPKNLGELRVTYQLPNGELGYVANTRMPWAAQFTVTTRFNGPMFIRAYGPEGTVGITCQIKIDQIGVIASTRSDLPWPNRVHCEAGAFLLRSASVAQQLQK